MSDVVKLVTVNERRDEGIREVAEEAFDFINDRLSSLWKQNRLSNFYIDAVVFMMARDAFRHTFDAEAAADFEVFVGKIRKESEERRMKRIAVKP